MKKFNVFDIVQSRVVTEKSESLSALRKYIFKVSVSSSKLDIKKAVENFFQVKVFSVHTMFCKGKQKFFRGKRGSRASYKKAIITLHQGNSIDVVS